MSDDADTNQEPEAAALSDLIGLAGIDDEIRSLTRQHLLRAVERLAALGVSAGDLSEVGQAYIRALVRVTVAEAEVISSAAGATADGEQLERELFGAAIELGHETFGVLHESMLQRALQHARLSRRSPASAHSVAVAHVDVVGSTEMLQQASAEQTQLLVDGLFTAGQSAIQGRAVEANKYVGDGVFFVGADPGEVAHAALDCLRSLWEEFGLSARAGLAFGPVIFRAGDVFGLPVNLSHLLTKAADPQTLLASQSAALRVPREMLGMDRRLDIHGLPAPVDAVQIVRS